MSLGAELKYDERPARMPTMFKVGFALDALRTGRQRLVASSEFEHPVDNTERANFGLEYSMGLPSGAFFLRGGYSLEYDTQGLAAGAGEGIDRRTDFYILKAAVFQHLLPARTRQATGNSRRP